MSTQVNPPWPPAVMRSFFIAQASPDPRSFHGSWNRLLNTLFPVDSMFGVVPESHPQGVYLLIYIGTSPVLVVQLKPPTDLSVSSKRGETDQEMRQYLLDCIPDLQIPTLYGISAFGTRFSCYEYQKDTGLLEPRSLELGEKLIDTTPEIWWNMDVVQEDGARKLRDIVEQVKAMCAEVPT